MLVENVAAENTLHNICTIETVHAVGSNNAILNIQDLPSAVSVSAWDSGHGAKVPLLIQHWIQLSKETLELVPSATFTFCVKIKPNMIDRAVRKREI